MPGGIWCAGTATAAAPAAFALPAPPMGHDDGTPLPTVQTVVVGGMPGWQIALIATAAAVVAAIAVFLDRAWAARRHQAAASA